MKPNIDALIIGYGNPLRGDDGIGWVAARRLEERIDRDSSKVITAHQLMPELAEEMSHASLVVFIDACHDCVPGSVKCHEVEPDPAAPGSMSHHFTPGRLLAMCQQLYHRLPETYVVTVGGAMWEMHQGLSDRVERAMDELVWKVESFLASHVGI